MSDRTGTVAGGFERFSDTGAGDELVASARTGDELRVDIHEIVDAVTPAWWRPLARRAATRLRRVHLEAVEQLQHLTSRV